MNKIKILALSVVLLTVVSTAFAQHRSEKIRADNLYKNLCYADAISLYRSILEHDSTNVEVLRNISNSYRLVGDYENAAHYYGILARHAGLVAREPLYYSQALLISGNSLLASSVMEKYHISEKLPPEMVKATYSYSKEDGADLLSSLKYDITNLSQINTPNSEIGAAFVGNSIVYSSNTYLNDYLVNKHKWTDKDFYSLRLLADNGKISILSSLNSRYNNGPSFYSSKENRLYVTENVADVRKINKQKDRRSSFNVVVYSLNKATTKWEKDAPFQFNNSAYNVGQVAVNPSGNVMAFVSDKPGGFGGLDIYFSVKRNGSWSEPINAGSNVNTSGNECFPSFYDDNTLCFSTDGTVGYGGLDIYYTHLNGLECTIPVAFPFPINTNSDDFGLQFSEDSRSALLVSNRAGGKGSDDIYFLELSKPKLPNSLIVGLVVDKLTQQPLPYAQVVLYDFSDNIIDSLLSDDNGRFSLNISGPTNVQFMGKYPEYFENRAIASLSVGSDYNVLVELSPKVRVSLLGVVLDKNTASRLDSVQVHFVDNQNSKRAYSIVTNKEGNFEKDLGVFAGSAIIDMNLTLERRGYYPKTVKLSYVIPRTSQINLTEKMDLTMIPISSGRSSLDDLIKPIHFDFNQWAIRPDAAKELDKIVLLLKSNPTLKLDIGSYTDCRGSDLYNMTLSKKRAEATVRYLVKKGVKPDMLVYQWYGKNKPAINCDCERGLPTTCTSKDHALNRRTEFFIIKP